MFSHRSTAWIWMAVIAGVAVTVAVFQFMRANRPEPTSAVRDIPIYTRGVVVDGVMALEPDQYVSHRLNFNKKMQVLGTHWTGDSRKRILVLILTEENFENWKAGRDFKAVTQTGYVPRGKVELMIDPGVYYLVYDNRSKEYGGVQRIDASFTAD